MHQLLIDLTEAQQKEVAPLLERAAEDKEQGRPGIVIAHVFKGAMRVGFLPHEKAKLFERTAADL